MYNEIKNYIPQYVKNNIKKFYNISLNNINDFIFNSIINTKTVYYCNSTYAEKRLIIHKNKNYKYRYVSGNQINEKNFFVNVKYSPNTVLHTFNRINMSTMKFVTSFETIIPRILEKKYDKYYDIGVKILSSERCVKLLALSDDALSKQIKFIKNFSVDVKSKEIIEKKLIRLYPPQKILNTVNRVDSNIIKFIFIGSNFFIKGGYEILLTLIKLRRRYKNFSLSIVSYLTLNEEWNVSRHSIDDILKTTEIIKNSDWITLYKGLKNSQVLALLKKHNVGLLPSFQETFGYSVLECQASSLPVITTNIRAFPETNNNNIGYIIEVPNKNGLTLSSDYNEIYNFKNCILQQLEVVIENILKNPRQIVDKGRLALERIEKMHCPIKYSEKLCEIYEATDNNSPCI